MKARQGPLLKVRNLRKYFPISTRLIFRRRVATVKAVNGVNFCLYPGETLGLVGESGCGKSTTGRLILRLIEPTAGEVLFQGQNIFQLGAADSRRFRQSTQIVFQDPYRSLDPRMRIIDIVAEPMDVHGTHKGEGRRQRVCQLLESVGLSGEHANLYPHQFSGGQRQRIGIARALSTNPKLIVCDEPVSALDVSLRAQVINLLKDLQQQFGFACLFIAHDLAVVKHVSDRVAVMYLGKIVELAPKGKLYESPQHPYTQALLSAVPGTQRGLNRGRFSLQGEVASPIDLPSGCAFHPRCLVKVGRCEQEEPEMRSVGEDRYVACHLSGKLGEKRAVGSIANQWH